MADVQVPEPRVSGFSDAVSKILNHPGEPRPKRRKREVPKKPALVDATGGEPSDADTGKPIKVSKKTIKQLQEPWHVLPSVTERDQERKLAKIATRGVIQLFNAVKQQQNKLEEQLEEAGPSIRKSEKALKSFSKGSFMELLKNPSLSKRTDTFEDAGGAPTKRWDVLDDEYLIKTSGDHDASASSDDDQFSESGDEDGTQEVF